MRMEKNEKRAVTAGEIAEKIQEIAPESLQESWDNSGFQVGSAEQRVSKVLTCLDLDFAVLKEAEKLGCEMIVTHHPLLFSGIKRLTDEEMTGRLLRRLVKQDITVYSCHTPFDKTKGGNNDVLAEILGLSGVRNLAGEKVESPLKMAENMKEADIGRSGKFRRSVNITQLIERLSKGLCIRPESIRIAMPVNDCEKQAEISEREFHRAGLCTGAGADLLPMARKLGCDVFVTGDVKYHEAQEAASYGICLIDAGHYGTEKTFGKNMQTLLTPKLSGRAEVLASGVDMDPFSLGQII